MSLGLSATMLLSLVWPTIVCAAAWAIAIWALNLPDASSALVNRLTGASEKADLASSSGAAPFVSMSTKAANDQSTSQSPKIG